MNVLLERSARGGLGAGLQTTNGAWMKGVLYDEALSYARRLWRYKWLSIGLACLICVIRWPIVSLIPPRYESSARIYVNADQLLTPLLKGIALDDNPLHNGEFLHRSLCNLTHM